MLNTHAQKKKSSSINFLHYFLSIFCSFFFPLTRLPNVIYMFIITLKRIYFKNESTNRRIEQRLSEV